ncbi:MAG: hypothetical protein HY794_13235 [Desulfarculus sp.]|nr:hypothetical protein [Desulfarculus sp.]
MPSCRAVAVALAHGGELAAVLTADPPPPAMPPDAQAEVVATAGRLVADGWSPDQARLLAPALACRRLGLPAPPEPALPSAVLAALLASLPVGGVAQ